MFEIGFKATKNRLRNTSGVIQALSCFTCTGSEGLKRLENAFCNMCMAPLI